MVRPGVIAAIFMGSMILFMLMAMELVASSDTIPPGEYTEEAVIGKTGSANITHAFYAAMGSVGISCIMSGYALARIGSAALGAMSEKPELGGRALIFLGMAEGIAIYGLIIAIMILNSV